MGAAISRNRARLFICAAVVIAAVLKLRRRGNFLTCVPQGATTAIRELLTNSIGDQKVTQGKSPQIQCQVSNPAVSTGPCAEENLKVEDHKSALDPKNPRMEVDASPDSSSDSNSRASQPSQSGSHENVEDLLEMARLKCNAASKSLRYGDEVALAQFKEASAILEKAAEKTNSGQLDLLPTVDRERNLVFVNRAMILRKLGDFKAAIECVSEALHIDENFPKALHLRGVLHREAGNNELAIQDLKQVLSIDPRNAASLMELIRAGADVAELAPKLPNPIDTEVYVAKVMTQEEFQKVAIPLPEISARLHATMEEQGFAIVTGVITSDELQELEDDFKRDLIDLVDEDALSNAPTEVQQAYKKFLEEGPRSFPLRTVIKHLTEAAGFVLKRCLAHGRFAWRIRRHPNVHAVYHQLFHDGGDMVTSLDVTFFTPEGQDSAWKNTFSAHVDQNMHDVRDGLANNSSFQGALYVWEAGFDGKSSTTVVWPGSHRNIWPDMMTDEAFIGKGEFGMHYSEVQSMSKEEYARELAAGWQLQARRVVAPRGSLLVWNSRTVHTGWRGGPRLAQAVCLEPASRRPEPERIAKLRLAALGIPGTHWASAGMQHDMCLGYPGVFAAEPAEAEEDGNGDLSQVVLPLRPAIRPAALAVGADMKNLKELVDVDYRLIGMWDPTEGSQTLLDASVKKEFADYL